jgi:dynein heavy chain 1
MAMALRSALRSYTAAKELVTPELEPLLHSNIKAIRQSVEEVFGVSIDQTVTVRSSIRIRWESKDIRDWIASLTELISLFEERVETIINSQDEIYRSIKQMESVEYSRNRFFELIQSIQKVIDNLSLASYANLEVWVEIMNKQLNGILSTRLQTALEVWTQSIKGLHVDGHHSLNSDELEKQSTRLKFSTIFIDIFLQNQEIVTFPPIPFVRELILKMFHDYSGAVCSLRSLHSSRYEIFGSSEHQSGSGKEFSDLMHQISPGILSECYHVIEHQMVEIATAVQQ